MAVAKRFGCAFFGLTLIAMLGCTGPIVKPSDKNWPEPTEAESWQAGVVSLAFSPDGKQLASSHRAMWPGKLRVSIILGPSHVYLWRVISPLRRPPTENIAAFELPIGASAFLHFSPDGKYLFAAPGKGLGLFQWDIAEQQLENRFKDQWVLISSDSRTVVYRNDIKIDRIEFLDAKTGRQIADSEKESEIGFPSLIAPNGQLLACIHDDDGSELRTLSFWHIPSRTKRDHTITDSMWGTFSPDSRYFACQLKEGKQIGVFDTTTGRLLKTLPIEETDVVRCLAFSQDSKLLAVGSESPSKKIKSFRQQGEIKLWDLQTGKLLKTLIDDSTWGITALCFSPTGETLASGSGSGQIKFWKTPKTSALQTAGTTP